jgi:hypothetical protein
MSSMLTDLCDEQAKCSGQVGRGALLSALRELAAYQRSSAGAPLVSSPVTSAYRCGGRWSRPGALFEVAGAGGPREGAQGAGRS